MQQTNSQRRVRYSHVAMAGRAMWYGMWLSVAILVGVQVSPFVTRVLFGKRASADDSEAAAWVGDPGQEKWQGGDQPRRVPRRRPPLSSLMAAGSYGDDEEVNVISAILKEQEEEPADEAAKRLAKLWSNPPTKGYHACVEPSEEYKDRKLRLKQPRGYLLVHANGGLNQMRAGICDMVAVARLLNATLVIPELDKHSFWNDASNFSQIFDEDYFIESLRDDVEVVRKLPPEFKHAEQYRAHFKSWSNFKYYNEIVGEAWVQYKVIRALKSDSRLANNDLPPDLQRLRCRVHYSSLRFAPHIERFAKVLLERMQAHGKFLALHLRYEQDMLAFSGCTSGLAPAEVEELTATRLSTKHWRVKEIDATEQRTLGLCPLTPHEVGLLLRLLGFPNTTTVYIAAGKIYGGEKRLDDLRHFFPRLVRKETLATPEELEAFQGSQNALAALDYIMAVESDVFVASFSGNMARAVEGHRRFLGHRKTIDPNRKELVRLFAQLQRGEIQGGAAFREQLELIHMHRLGAPRMRRGPITGSRGKDKARSEESFYTNPLPDCICRDEHHSLPGDLVTAIRRKPSKKKPPPPPSSLTFPPPPPIFVSVNESQMRVDTETTMKGGAEGASRTLQAEGGGRILEGPGSVVTTPVGIDEFLDKKTANKHSENGVMVSRAGDMIEVDFKKDAQNGKARSVGRKEADEGNKSTKGHGSASGGRDPERKEKSGIEVTSDTEMKSDVQRGLSQGPAGIVEERDSMHSRRKRRRKSSRKR
eukprot:TRINITY_DN4306_c0_g1_i1.p1 TRINITY_DN4306_c0_g1~~TRINITY_DN4306_c0_g1_i1.p1  ORF type:complete len:760 (+),score=162.86 TRINITY_DN4306_c0_g1_i1:269-2548(+)